MRAPDGLAVTPKQGVHLAIFDLAREGDAIVNAAMLATAAGGVRGGVATENDE